MPGLLQEMTTCKVDKYTVVIEDNGQVRVERGDDPNWMVNPEGSKMLIAMAHEINRLRGINTENTMVNTAALTRKLEILGQETTGVEPRFFCPNQITDESDEKGEPMCVDLDCSLPAKPCAGGYKPDA